MKNLTKSGEQGMPFLHNYPGNHSPDNSHQDINKTTSLLTSIDNTLTKIKIVLNITLIWIGFITGIVFVIGAHVVG